MTAKDDRVERTGWTSAIFGRRERDTAGPDSDENLRRTLFESMEHASLLERILDATDEGVALLEAGGEVLLTNRAARVMLEIAPGRSSPALGALDLPQSARRAIESGEPVAEERELHFPVRRILSIRVLPFDGRALALIADVTHERRSQQVRRDFVANVSHELKTPIAGLALIAEQLAHAVREDTPAALRFAEHIHQETDRLARLVVDLLDLSRIESDMAPVVADVDSTAVVSDALGRVERIAHAKDISIVVAAPETPVQFRADPAMAATALANLLDNAVRFSAPGGSVRVVVDAAADEVAFAVEDEGPGIPTEELGRIFERFYRVDKARSRATGGTGLGLSIVKHIAERHGGRVEATSEYGRGSTFRITFPLEGATE
ncbi:MAG TPA: ATP-binding protein [Actinomycetota bacterium]